MRSFALLFDMDGVLVDSEPVITESAVQALHFFGIPAKHEDFLPFTGMGEIRFLGGVAEKYGFEYRDEMKSRTYEIYGALVDDNLVVYPETLGVLARLKAEGYKMALASSADLVKVEHNLRVAGIPKDTFGAIITAEDAERKKPFPDLFLAAAKALHVDPADALVIEDALSGIRAGLAAGAKVIAVETSFPADKLLAEGASMAVRDISMVPDAIARLEKE